MERRQPGGGGGGGRGGVQLGRRSTRACTARRTATPSTTTSRDGTAEFGDLHAQLSNVAQGNFQGQVDERPEMYLMGDELQAHLEAHA